MKIMVHGDSKIDNFLFRKVAYSEEDTYSSVIVDWQGVCYDFLSRYENFHMKSIGTPIAA